MVASFLKIKRFFSSSKGVYPLRVVTVIHQGLEPPTAYEYAKMKEKEAMDSAIPP